MRVLLLLLVFATCTIFGIEGQCRLSMSADLPRIQPLILKPGVGEGFRYPKQESVGILEFEAGENVRLVCIGENNTFKNLEGKRKDVIATCVKEKTFAIPAVAAGNSIEIAFVNLECNSRVQSADRESQEKCHNSKTNVELGYDLGNNEWITVINACHDKEGLETIYTKFTLRKEIGSAYADRGKDIWIQSSYWPGYNLKTQFNSATQITVMGTILDSADLAARYINTKKQKYLSRGHLSANSDFVYYAEQMASFYYVNMAPQWQSFNGGNWQELEGMLHTFASRSNDDLTVYTGVHDIAQLPNVAGTPTNLYLYAEGNKRAIPIPKFFWRIIYNEKTKKGTAFVGVNNPYIENLPDEDVPYDLCRNITSQISWLKWKLPRSKSRGISWACTVDSLRQKVHTIPPFEVDGILS